MDVQEGMSLIDSLALETPVFVPKIKAIAIF